MKPAQTGWLLLAVAVCVLALGTGVEGWSWQPALLPLRMLRWGAAVVVGVALAIAGYGLQAITRNPMADPFLLGVSGGAAVGAAMASMMLFVAPDIVTVEGPLSVGAAIGAAAVVALLTTMLRRQRGAERMILLGMSINAAAWAVVAVVRAVAPAELGQRMSRWLVGSISYPSSWLLLTGAAIVAICAAVLFGVAPALGLMRLGDDDARRSGVNVVRVQQQVMMASSLAVAVAMMLGGAIAFVGLFVPLWSRRMAGATERVALLWCAALGAAVMCGADATVRMAFSWVHTELPVGAILAGVGGPLFGVWLWQRPSGPS